MKKLIICALLLVSLTSMNTTEEHKIQASPPTCYSWVYAGSYTTQTGQVYNMYTQQCCNGGPELTFLDCYFNFHEVPQDQ